MSENPKTPKPQNPSAKKLLKYLFVNILMQQLVYDPQSEPGFPGLVYNAP